LPTSPLTESVANTSEALEETTDDVSQSSAPVLTPNARVSFYCHHCFVS
jgi:hypothetical protein